KNLEGYKKFSKKIRRLVLNAKYEEALNLSKKAQILFPDVPLVTLDYFTIMADCGSIIGGAKGRRLHENGTKGLQSLLNKIRSFGPEERVYVKNEVYFQTKQFKKQYELGIKEFKKSKNRINFYSAGVGAAWYANEMFKKGQIKRCRSWAKKSVDAWKKYFEYRKDYYNPYVHYALALGFLGRIKEMEQSLENAMKLSKKPEDFVEFKEVREIIELFNLKN